MPDKSPYSSGGLTREIIMRLDNGRQLCRECGAEIYLPADVPADEIPKVTIRAGNGHPATRVLSIGGHKIHECELTLAEQI